MDNPPDLTHCRRCGSDALMDAPAVCSACGAPLSGPQRRYRAGRELGTEWQRQHPPTMLLILRLDAVASYRTVKAQADALGPQGSILYAGPLAFRTGLLDALDHRN